QTVTQTVVRPILLDTTGANIVTSLNAIATALQGGDISATSSLPTASIDYVDSIKLLIGTQSGYETGGIYQCTESGGIYSWTLLNGSGGGGGTGGHTIEDGTGTDMTARTNLQFVGASVTDDSSNNRTVVSVADKADKVQSATENNLAKFDSTGNLADSGVADTSLVHKTGNETIGGTKTFTDEIISKSVGISPLNLVSGSSSTETWLKYTKGTDNSTLGLIGVKSDNKPYFYDSSAKRIALMEEVDAITNVATVESTTTASKPYTTGERLVLGGVLYKVTAAIASGGTIVTSGTGQNVDATTVDAEINGKADLTVLAPAFDASETYKRGQYVTYNGKLYRESTIDGHSGAWDADDFEETKVKDIRITGGKNPLSNIPLGFVATAEGDLNEASGDCSHAQGQDCSAEGNYSHAAGLGTKATKKCQTVIGRYNDNEIFTSKGADGNYAFQIGNGTSDASRSNAFSVKWNGDTSINGALTVSNGVKGYVTAGQRTGSTLGSYATAEGFDTRATNSGTHAEGAGTLASGESSHAEGSGTQATNYHAHAEGRDTIASGIDSHVEGRDGIALGICSHAEGMTTRANGDYSHAEGRETISDGIYSHAGGIGTIAQRKSQTTIGEYNVADTTGADGTVRGEYAFIVGNGTATNARSNAMTVSWSGDISDGHGNVLNEMFWKGTSSEWTALPAATKAKYAGKPVYLTDDAGVYTGMPQPYKFTLTGTGSVVTTTFSHASVTADMRVIDSTISNPSAVLSDMTITPANGSLTVSATVNGTTEVLLIMQPCRSEITLT
ncbi:MAG: hypothetical protein IKN54_01280, partial [Lachnospiraceae bacterium]|nr:hypothetical protein [Lachnospiraceae bacterium]